MKKLSVFLITIALSFCLIGCNGDDKQPLEPTADFFVNDFAGVIDSSDRSVMLKSGKTLYEKTEAQVVVVSVDSLEGEDIETYALNLARRWGLGDKEKDNGVLLLLSVKDREVRLEIGRGLEGALPDSKTGRIIDHYGIEHLKNDDFSNGLTEIYKAVVNEVYIEYGMEPDGNYTPADELPEDYSEEGIPGAVVYAFILLMVLLAVLSRFSGPGGRFGGPRFFFTGLGGGFGGTRGGFSGGGGFRGGGGGFSGGGSSRGF